MEANRNKPEQARDPWHAVLDDLRGARLAIYDDLLRLGALDYKRLTIAVKGPDEARAAITWLAVNRFITLHDGRWVARSIPAARDVFRTEGRDVEPIGAMPPDLREVAVQKTERGRDGEKESRPVHGGQVQFFDMEGYRQI